MKELKKPKHCKGSRAKVCVPGRADVRYVTYGGWKVHLTIGKTATAAEYEARVSVIAEWLDNHFEGYPSNVWKSASGGEPHKKDFTVYLGSHETMSRFVADIEASDACREIDTSASGEEDRIVGTTGKCGARFAPGPRGADPNWSYGLDGIPFKYDESMRFRIARISPSAELKRARKAQMLILRDTHRIAMRERYGTYFLPEGSE